MESTTKRRNHSCADDDAKNVTGTPSSLGAAAATVRLPINDEKTEEEKRKGREERNTRAEENEWPRFLYIGTPDGERLCIPQYAMSKAIQGIATKAERVTRLKCGDYIVQVAKTASKALLETKQMAGTNVSVTAHRSLNTSKGVIRSIIFRDSTNEDIQNELENQGVVKARRILRREGKHLLPTNIIVLTFRLFTRPPHINVDGETVYVGPYFPKPIRCYRCQKFGHSTRGCKNKAKCAICGKEDHTISSCTTDVAACANCKGDHTAFSPLCPIWIKEQLIIKTKTRLGITSKEARDKLMAEDEAAYSAKVKLIPVSKPESQPKPKPQPRDNYVMSNKDRHDMSLLEATVQHLQALVQHMAGEMEVLKKAVNSKTKESCNLEDAPMQTPIVPNHIQFGRSASPSFILTEDQETGAEDQETAAGDQETGAGSQETDAENQETGAENQETGVGPQVEHQKPMSGDRTPRKDTQESSPLDLSASFTTADEGTPTDRKSKKAPHKFIGKWLMTSTPKHLTDSSYLMSMMDSVGKSDMDGLILNQTAHILKKPRRVENLVSGAITRNIYTEGNTKKAAVSKYTSKKPAPKVTTRIFTATPKETAASKETPNKKTLSRDTLKRLHPKILSPKSKPPVYINISPSATRSGTLLRRHNGGTNE